MPAMNDPNQGGSGALAELFRLQTEFSARLADETLRYLRRLQGAIAPAAPGTIVLQDPDLLLTATATTGGRAELVVEVENLQRVHCLVRPQLTPLVSTAGVTWFPEADPNNVSTLVAPGETAELRVGLIVPAVMPAGDYRGALLLEGFREQGLPVLVTVGLTAAISAAADAVTRASAAEPGPVKPAAARTNAPAAAKPTRARATATSATTPAATPPAAATPAAATSAAATSAAAKPAPAKATTTRATSRRANSGPTPIRGASKPKAATRTRRSPGQSQGKG